MKYHENLALPIITKSDDLYTEGKMNEQNMAEFMERPIFKERTLQMVVETHRDYKAELRIQDPDQF